MAFMRYANANVIKAGITLDGWGHVGSPGVTFDKRASADPYRRAGEAAPAIRVVPDLKDFDPDRYLLSHATIIASVDTEVPQPEPVLGKHMVDGVQIDRRYRDYYVSPKTAQFVNSNGDSWERKLLLATYRTFVGSHNYLEHVQLPELSKGRIIDAVARDIGDSVYVDILVATDRKHRALIDAISSGRLATLSMGCQVSDTTCTQCGNTAEDETQLCPHIRYSKGNEFIDEMGIRRVACELCGHVSNPESVKFIEASWVAHPAFKGAVLRNILVPQDASAMGKRIQTAFSIPQVVDPNAMRRAAKRLPRRVAPAVHPRQNVAAEEDFDFTQGQQGGGGGQEAKPADDPMNKIVDELTGVVREKVLERLRTEMNSDEVPRQSDTSEDNNDTLIKSAMAHPEWRKMASVVHSLVGDGNVTRYLVGLILYKGGGWKRAASLGGYSGRDMLILSRLVDRLTNRTRAGDQRIYRTVLKVGGLNYGDDESSYLAACRSVLGRDLTPSEAKALIQKGRILAMGRA